MPTAVQNLSFPHSLIGQAGIHLMHKSIIHIEDHIHDRTEQRGRPVSLHRRNTNDGRNMSELLAKELLGHGSSHSYSLQNVHVSVWTHDAASSDSARAFSQVPA